MEIYLTPCGLEFTIAPMREKETIPKSAPRDYCTVIESFPVPPTQNICDSIRGELEEMNSYQEGFDFLQERIGGLVS